MLIQFFADLQTSLVKREQAWTPFIAYFYNIMATILLTTCNIFIKKLNHLTPYEILYYRSAQHCIYTFLFMKLQGMQFHYKETTITRMLISRGLVGCGGVTFGYIAVTLLPISEVAVVNQTTPVMVGILSALLLNNKYEISQFFAAVLCIGGVILMAKPEFLFGSSERKSDDALTGIICSISGCFFAAIVKILIKKVGEKTNMGITTLYFGAAATMFSTFLVILKGTATPSLQDCIYMFYIGFLSFGGQLLMNRSYILGNPARVALMSYFGIIYAFFLDFIFIGVNLDAYSIGGSILIFSCLFVSLYRNYKDEKSKAKKAVTS